MMSQWAQVRALFEQSVATDRACREREAQVLEAQRAVAAWYRLADEEIRIELETALTGRTLELAQLGAQVLLQPAQPITTTAGGWRLELGYLDERVWVYSVRSEVDLQVHWAWQLRRPGARFPRLLSVPGFRVRPGPRHEMQLEPFGSTAPVMTSLEDTACQLLGMLVNAAHRRRPASRCYEATWSSA